mgnify:FL=1
MILNIMRRQLYTLPYPIRHTLFWLTNIVFRISSSVIKPGCTRKVARVIRTVIVRILKYWPGHKWPKCTCSSTMDSACRYSGAKNNYSQKVFSTYSKASGNFDESTTNSLMLTVWILRLQMWLTTWLLPIKLHLVHVISLDS